MARETPEQRVRREQRELMERLNAERDKKIPVREQNQMRMRGGTPTTGRTQAPAPAPQGTAPRTIPLGGLAGRAQSAISGRQRQVDAVVDEAVTGKPKPRSGSGGGGGRGRR